MITPFFKKITLNPLLTVTSSETSKCKTFTIKLLLIITPYANPVTVILVEPLADFAEKTITHGNFLCQRD